MTEETRTLRIQREEVYQVLGLIVGEDEEIKLNHYAIYWSEDQSRGTIRSLRTNYVR